jgi:hypothetical protein
MFRTRIVRRVWTSESFRRAVRPLARRLTAHSTRIAKSQIAPVRKLVDGLSKRLDEQRKQLADQSVALTRITADHAELATRLSEVAGRVEAMRYRMETLEPARDGLSSVPDIGA